MSAIKRSRQTASVLPLLLTVFMSTGASAQNLRVAARSEQNFLHCGLGDDFAAVTIKPNKNATHGGGGVTAIGYQATGITISRLILYSYSQYPSAPWRDDLLSGPSWLTTDRYDVTAKLDLEAELAWQKLGRVERLELIRPCLQGMLAERFKLTIHRKMEQGEVYGLFIGSSTSRLKPSNPRRALPVNVTALELSSIGQGAGTIIPIQDGTKSEVSFFATPMSSLALFLSNTSQRLVIDKTGLSGTYDFVLPEIASLPDPVGTGGIDARDLGIHGSLDLGSVGLRLKSVSSPIEKWVVVHIEKPSPN